jgi:hypothetical protein
MYGGLLTMPATPCAKSATGSYQLPTNTRTLSPNPQRPTLYIAQAAASSLASTAVTWKQCTGRVSDHGA